jgi:DNA-binding transcriptional LysR family regulator
MELRQMQYAVAVAEVGTFTGAARRCHIAQSALSHQIAQLERELGTPLFVRSSRSVSITTAGTAFIAAARRALAAVDQARADVAASIGEVSGPLRIGTIPTLTAVRLPALIAEYRTRHPAVEIGLVVGASEHLVDQVRDETLDVAFVGVAPQFVVRGVSERELAIEELAALVPSAWPPAAPLTLSGLATRHEFVDFPRGSAARQQTDTAFERAGVPRRVAYEVGSIELMDDFVAQGLGVALVPAGYLVRGAVTGAVRFEPLQDPPLRSQRVVWPAAPNPAAAAFLAGLGIDAD